jgi:hypothetical protein
VDAANARRDADYASAIYDAAPMKCCCRDKLIAALKRRGFAACLCHVEVRSWLYSDFGNDLHCRQLKRSRNWFVPATAEELVKNIGLWLLAAT